MCRRVFGVKLKVEGLRGGGQLVTTAKWATLTIVWSDLQVCNTHKPPNMSPGMTLFAVQAVLILGTEDGARIFSKYYSPPHASSSMSSSNPRPLMSPNSIGQITKGIIDLT